MSLLSTRQQKQPGFPSRLQFRKERVIERWGILSNKKKKKKDFEDVSQRHMFAKRLCWFLERWLVSICLVEITVFVQVKHCVLLESGKTLVLCEIPQRMRQDNLHWVALPLQSQSGVSLLLV